MISKFALASFILILFNFISLIYGKGTVILDTYTFDKVLSKFKCALVKFDEAYPYGPKENEYTKFAEFTYQVNDLLVAVVGVKDYGEKDNEDLAQRFDVKKENFPAVKLFIEGHNEPYTFDYKSDEEFTVTALRNFVQKHDKNIYIGAPGCIESFDKLATKFSISKSERKSILKEAEDLWDTITGQQEQKSADVYVKAMRKMIEKGDDFIKTEIERVSKILKGDLSKDKKTEFNNRLNILSSFFTVHDEL